MRLNGRNAVIYGAGGSMGGAVARAFAAEGARVFVTGRTAGKVHELADDIAAGGGAAHAAQVDALDAQAVSGYLDGVASRFATLDLSFCAIDISPVQGVPLVEMSLGDFLSPIRLAMESQFITATAAGRIMKRQRSGVILLLTATPGGIGYPNVGGFGPACAAMEAFSRNLASELGPFGVRVVTVRSGGSPDSRIFQDAVSANPQETEAALRKMRDDTMLKELPPMADIARAAVFLASEDAARITGITLDVTCGTTAALNYRVPPIAFVER